MAKKRSKGTKSKRHGKLPLKGDPRAKPDVQELDRLLELCEAGGLMNDRDPTDEENAEFCRLFWKVMATGYRFPKVEPWVDDDCFLCIELKKSYIYHAGYPEGSERVEVEEVVEDDLEDLFGGMKEDLSPYSNVH